eukprot:jgi/Mesvir1/18421/Mv14290-RA.2
MRTCAPKSPILALVLLGTVLFSFICVLEHTGSRVRSQSGATYAKSRLWNGLREIQTTSLGFRSNGSNPMYTSIAFIKTHRTGSSTLGGIFFRFANSKGLRVFSSPDHILRIPQHIVQGPMSTHFSLVLQHFSQRGRFGGDIRHVFAYFRHLLQDDGSIAFVTILREPVAHLLSYLRYYVAPDLVPPAHANTTTHQTTVPYGDHRVQPTITTNGHTAASGKSIQTRGRVELDGTLQLEGDAVVPVEHVAPSSWQGNGPLDALPLLGKGNLDKTGADFASPPPQSASAALEQLLASLVEDGSIAEVANPLAAEFGLYSEEDVRRFVAEFVFAGEGLPLPSPWFFFAVTEHFDESLVCCCAGVSTGISGTSPTFPSTTRTRLKARSATTANPSTASCLTTRLSSARPRGALSMTSHAWTAHCTTRPCGGSTPRCPCWGATRVWGRARGWWGHGRRYRCGGRWKHWERCGTCWRSCVSPHVLLHMPQALR